MGSHKIKAKGGKRCTFSDKDKWPSMRNDLLRHLFPLLIPPLIQETTRQLGPPYLEMVVAQPALGDTRQQ